MTDHITLPRSVVEQAIEFTQFCWRDVAMNDYAEEQRSKTEAILRAALAGAAQAEPVAVGEVRVMGSYGGKPALGCLLTLEAETRVKAGDKLYTTPQPAQPVAVPAPGEFTVSEYPLPLESGFATRRYGIRVTHRSGVYAECGDSRSQHANRQKAWEMLVEKLKSGAAAPTPPAVTVEEPQDSYDDIWHALQEIETFAVFLPTFEVIHEGGLKACTKNIVEAIKKAANLPPAATVPVLEPLSQAEVVEGFCKQPHDVQYVRVFDAGVRFAEAAHAAKLAKRGGV